MVADLLLLYTGRWFLSLLALFVLGNVVVELFGDVSTPGRVVGMLNANVREQGNKWVNWYDIGQADATAASRIDAIVPEDEEENDDDDDDDESVRRSPEIVIGKETDPILLAKARDAMISRRANLLEIEKLERTAMALRGGVERLEDTIRRWTMAYPDIDFVKEDVEGENETASGDVSR